MVDRAQWTINNLTINCRKGKYKMFDHGCSLSCTGLTSGKLPLRKISMVAACWHSFYRKDTISLASFCLYSAPIKESTNNRRIFLRTIRIYTYRCLYVLTKAYMFSLIQFYHHCTIPGIVWTWTGWTTTLLWVLRRFDHLWWHATARDPTNIQLLVWVVWISVLQSGELRCVQYRPSSKRWLPKGWPATGKSKDLQHLTSDTPTTAPTYQLWRVPPQTYHRTCGAPSAVRTYADNASGENVPAHQRSKCTTLAVSA